MRQTAWSSARPETGERWSGTLAPGEALSDGTTAYPLSFPGAEAGWAVYGITEHTDGSREAALYLTAGGCDGLLYRPTF